MHPALWVCPLTPLFSVSLQPLFSSIYGPTLRKFVHRHIGIREDDLSTMLSEIGIQDLDTLIDETIPSDIRTTRPLELPAALSERAYLKHIRQIAGMNMVFRSYIGQGYYGTIVPPVIQRGIFENPGWYTQYTPYQAEISQGRLEALLNYQTVVSDLTGLPIANASLLDEATAAAEAMAMFFSAKNKRQRTITRFFVDEHVYVQTLEVLRSRAIPLGIEVVTGSWKDFRGDETFFGAMCQFPNAEGAVEDYRDWVAGLSAKGIHTVVASDLMALTLLTPPGEWGADAVVGNSQRFGVPMGFGGPHAAFFATTEDFKRVIPGRIIGVSVDTRGKRALRMALQTREQHIKREKATSNICTAQALLATMAGMYAVYHGPDGLSQIATYIHTSAQQIADALKAHGLEVAHRAFFDTIRVTLSQDQVDAVRKAAEAKEINFHYKAGGVQIAIGEAVLDEDIQDIVAVFTGAIPSGKTESNGQVYGLPAALKRTSTFLTHPTFNRYTSETEMMRYMKSLENKDLSLLHAMISLGSCTMKLNAAAELMPVSWHAFGHMHPFAPASQTKGYRQMISELEQYLCRITNLHACSLMPNSGAQGELTGLLTIRAYHESRGEGHRDVALIPQSAHGTNPASAAMAAMQVVVVKTDDAGNIDVDDLEQKAQQYSDKLSCLMVTYPSTHGVFEVRIREIIGIVHRHSGLVYMDGANMNAQVGLTSPGEINADVCHLNLHKTFAIPHGGGGPGMGPICVNEKLAPFLPKHHYADIGGAQGILPVNAAPWGSASILLISYAYIRMLGPDGVTDATKYAILNANYMASRLAKHYDILFTGAKGRVAHEFILDLRPFKEFVSAEDVAKRLIDYGFHAPTLSFPVAGTIMIEPTESESLAELDRFCDAMIQIRREIEEVMTGAADRENNVLHNAPHTVDLLMDEKWKFPYSREKAVFPVPSLYQAHKFWPTVTRIDGAYGDRNLVCTCPPIEAYAEAES